jgi:threonine/homoserine/homoserine lactone efflux protein
MISLQFLLTAFVVVIPPGTGVVYTLAMGLGRGRRAALGLAAVLHASALLFNAVKCAGVLYLLWLALGALRQTGALAVQPAAPSREALWRVARRGVLINVLNPKLSIFFLALLPPFLSGDPGTATLEMAALGAVFMAMTWAVFALYGLFASAFRDWVLASERAMAWLNRCIAGVFAALAVRLAAERA